MELEALQEINLDVRALGARIVALTPEFERYTRSLHKKLNLTFDILTDPHLRIADSSVLCLCFLITYVIFINLSA